MGFSRGESDRKNFEQSLALMELDGKTPATERFPFAIESGWNRRNLRLAVFV